MTAETLYNVLKALDESELKRFDKMYNKFKKSLNKPKNELSEAHIKELMDGRKRRMNIL